MLNEILNIYDCGLRDGKKGLTQTEAIHRIVEKINLIIEHFNVLEYNCNKSIKDFAEKVEYYLNNGMIDEVSKKLDEFAKNGTLDRIINDNILDEIKNNSITIEVKYPDEVGIVQKYILEDNAIAGIRKKYIHCMVYAQQWQSAWENISGDVNNNNGGIWIPFYWAVNTEKVIDETMTLRDLNKWNWQSLGYSKIGIYGIGGINENGCYVYIENKQPTESTIGVTFTICITELYK